MNTKDNPNKVTPENADTKARPRLATLALIGAFALVAAFALAGCVENGGNEQDWEMQEVLEGSEVPGSLENCELREEFDNDWDEETDEFENGPVPLEVGMQFLAPAGTQYCEDAPYMIIVSMLEYSESDFEQVMNEHEENYTTDSEWDDSEFDYCEYGLVMWGDNRVVSATPMDPRMFAGEWDGTEAPMAGHEDDYERVRDALTTKYPDMDGPC